jgi:hypothetical protein
LVTIGDPARGGQHLAEVGPEVVGKPGSAQRLERERVIMEQELHI